MKKLIKKILTYPIGLLNSNYTRSFYSQAQDLDFILNDYKGDKILVVAPHVDDETIGLGGTIISSPAKDKSLVYVTDGSKATSELSVDQLIKAREKEARDVARLYGFDDLYFLKAVDSEVDSSDEGLINKLVEILNKKNPDQIFTPFLLDGHRDHVESTRLLLNAIKVWKPEFDNIWMYEVNTMNQPRLINRINGMNSSILSKKENVYKVFESQNVMGFDAFLLIDKMKALLVKNKQYAGAECFIALDLNTGLAIDKVLRDNNFSPEDFRQLSSRFNLLKSFKENKEKKMDLSNKIYDILK